MSKTPFVRALERDLASAASEQTKQWWERYLKGAVAFRGVPMGDIRRIAHALWSQHDLDQLTPDEQIDTALSLFAQRYAEEKLAGILILSERLLGELQVRDVPRLAEPFSRGYIDDWSTCDWYCIKLLGRLVKRSDDRRAAARAIAGWRSAQPLWQRRAAAVSFVELARLGDGFFKGFISLLLTVCSTNVRDSARFSQTSVGWLLRELSHAEPDPVESFVRRHRDRMSSEALRAATAKLDHELRVELLRRVR